MPCSSVIGQAIAKLLLQRNWTQEVLAAKMQISGCDISRDVIANIELGRTAVTDGLIVGFVRVFGVRLRELFPPEVQQLDEQADQLLRKRAGSRN